MMRRVRLVIGVFLVGLSTVAVLGAGLQEGFSAKTAIVLAFFLGVIYAGWQLVRANWKNEREHQVKLERLIDDVRDDATGSDRPGGTDARDQPRK